MRTPAPIGEAADAWIDPALAPLGVFVETLSTAVETLDDPVAAQSLYVESMRVDLPFEMDLAVDEGGNVALAGGPPTQYTETSVMPVFHRIRLEVQVERSDAG